MNEYVNLTLENIYEEHICCALRDLKHRDGVATRVSEFIGMNLN